MDARTDGGREDELEGLVLEVLEDMEAEGEAALERACAAHPDSSAALRARLQALRSAGLLEAPDAAFPERLGEFRLLAHLGGGGMGVVYLAQQESLGREVALKLIRPDLLYFPDARLRFRREVETVARLQHPGIVPVYAVGEESGVPYFVMERVRGATLAEVLGELAGREPSELRARDLGLALEHALERRGLGLVADAPLFEGSWVDACLRLVEAVASALEHAHAEGVLHRDVKPSNVLLAADGRALLFDFGLSASEDASELTKTGALVGSLPYMAPEQLQGGALDRRTDVYGLGATLHELLTLRPPHAAADSNVGAAALRQAILGGPPPPPGRTNRAVPRDLDLVLARALDPEPERRYASPAELARDLRNVRELRPVSARPAGPLLRARRWAQRHPARAALVALSLLVAVGGPSVLAVQRGRANERIRAALDEAHDERERAEANLDRAVDAVAGLLGEFGGSTLRDVPGMTEARARLLERSRSLLAELASQRPDDPRLSVQQARVLTEGALVIDDLGRSGAIEDLDQAVALLEAAVAAEPDRREPRFALARAVASRGSRAIDRFALAEGEPWLVRARGMLEQLVGEDPDDADALVALRQVEGNLSSLYVGQERFDQATRHAAAACTLARELVERDGSPDARFALADSLGLLGRAERDPQRAVDAERESLGILRDLLGEGERQRWLEQAASIASHLAGLLTAHGRFDEAERVCEEHLPGAERLVEAWPAVPDDRRLLAELREARAMARAWQGDLEQALVWMREAVTTYPASGPEQPTWLRFSRASALHNLAITALEARRPEEARDALREASAELEALRGDRVGLPQVERDSVLARVMLAQTEAELGTLPDADELEGLVAERAPDDAQTHFALAAALAVAARTAGAPLDGGPGPPQAEELVSRALEALLGAFRLGFQPQQPLERTRELDVLRARPEYELVLAAEAR